jgi:uncharacterized membrane protein (DUF2068 family)
LIDGCAFNDDLDEMQSSSDRWIELIAFFKLAKAVLLAAVAIGALKLVHRDVAQVVEPWIYMLQLDPNNQYIQKFLTKLWSVDERTLKEISAGTFCYAGLFFVEGAGLFLRKRWASYFTIIVTASFLPFEVYELLREASVFKAAVIGVNVAIIVYLFVRLRQQA